MSQILFMPIINAFSISRDPKLTLKHRVVVLYLEAGCSPLVVGLPTRELRAPSYCGIYTEAGCSPLEVGLPTRELRAPSYCNYIVISLRSMVYACSRSGVRLKSEAPSVELYIIIISVVLMRLYYNQELCARSDSSPIYIHC